MNNTLKCFNCSTNSYSFEESIRALHSTPSVKEEEKEHMHAHLGDVARLHHLTTFLLYLFNQGNFHESFLLFSKAKN